MYRVTVGSVYRPKMYRVLNLMVGKPTLREVL